MISAITCFPNGFDYPIFRDKMPDLLDQVDEVLICFTKHGNYDLSPWIKHNMNYDDYVRYFDEPTDTSQDWRSRSTNLLINNAKGDWILSIEQDFLIFNYPEFFGKIKEAMPTHDVIMFTEGQRFHPAFLLVRTDILKKTKRDFSVMGDGRDHFHQITKELKGLNARAISLEELDLIDHHDYHHLAGLTENYFAPKPYYRLDEFYAYNDFCKSIEPMSDYWRGEMKRCSNTEK